VSTRRVSGNRYYRQLRRQLRRCRSGRRGRKCRKAALNRFRLATERREEALIKHLRHVARVYVARSIKRCVRRFLDKPAERAACTKKVENWETVRLAILEKRALNLQKRRALRMCEKTSSIEKCAKQVKTEFKKDVGIAKAAAKDQAKKDVATVTKTSVGAAQATGNTGSSRRSAGAAIASGLAVLMVALVSVVALL